MQLDAANAVLRPRNHWEAIDLGFAMARRWLPNLYGAWFVVLLPLVILLHVLCFQFLWLVPLLVWWLKPLLDRIPLYILSRALFDDPPSTRQTLKIVPALLWRQALPALTWLRLDPARSFHLPVSQLEGLKGRQRRQRQAVLDMRNRGAGAWLTVTCLHLEIALEFAILGMGWLLFPEFVELDLAVWLEQHSALDQILFNLVAIVSISVMEPFYVAAGFALYLNRRTLLEAWDIEIGFRRLARRLKSPVSYGAAAALAAVIMLCPFIPERALADAVEEPNPVVSPACQRLFAEQSRLRESASEIKQTLAEVLQEPEFPRCTVQQIWHFKAKAEEPQAQAPSPWAKWLASLLAEGIELLLWLAVAAAVAIVLWWALNQARRYSSTTSPRRSTDIPSLVIHGEKLTPDAFSAGAGADAWQLWQAGNKRQALRLLYRGSLVGLLVQHGIDFGRSATEDECLRHALEQLPNPELTGYFRHLTRAWQSIAYAHRAPESEEMQRLCEQWPSYFHSRDCP